MNSVFTIKARSNLMKARAEGIAVPQIIGMAFGDGAVTQQGDIIQPREDQKSLNNEIYRKELTGHEYTGELKCKYTCYLTADEIPNSKINELALYDSNNDLVAIKNFLTKEKDDDLEMEFQIEDNFESEVE